MKNCYQRIKKTMSLILVIVSLVGSIPIQNLFHTHITYGAIVQYAPYTGVSYDYVKSSANMDNRRYVALQKAQKMATVKWTAPVSFATWLSSGGSYNSVCATDGTVSREFIAGKTYVGIPYSMANHSADETSWVNKISSATTRSSLEGRYYTDHTKNTTGYGSDCSYMIYLAFKEAVGSSYSFNYQATWQMMSGSHYTKIASCNNTTIAALKSKILPADVVISNGHTMLFVGMNGNKFAFFEAKPSLTTYSEYSLSELSGYSFYRFNGFQDGGNTGTTESLTVDTSYSVPLKCYTLGTGNITTYQYVNVPFSGASYITGSTDECTILQVYTNGWVKVSYPVSSGTKTAYAKLSDFINTGVSHYNIDVSKATTVYRRSDLSQAYGEVYSTDNIIVVGKSGTNLQIIYNLSNNSGYKMGWIPESAVKAQDNLPKFNVEFCTGECNKIHVGGWTYDPDAPNESLEVHVYVGGPAGTPGAICYPIQANSFRGDVNQAFGISGNHGFDSYIDVSAVGETEIYIYAINKGGTHNPIIGSAKVNIDTDNELPSIYNIQVSNVSSSGYTVTCQVSDNIGISKVQFPTWTTYGNQDDIASDWGNNSIVSGTINGSTVTYRVNISDHNNETGLYNTHIYAYDARGNYTCAGVDGIYVENGYTPVKAEVYKNHIYAAFTEPLTWKEAKAKCEEMGGHLVTITSAGENEVVKRLALEGMTAYYIGATDEISEGTWKWVTGESFSYQSWNAGEPNNYNTGEDYAAMYVDSQWNDVSGNNEDYAIGFIMEIDSKLTATEIAVHGESVYELYDISMPWELAKMYCELYDSNLACVTTENENTVIAELSERGNLQNYYLGATDKASEGTWKWVTGESFSYKNWLTGQPDNRSGDAIKGPENYLTYDTYSDGWNDTKGCLGSAGFIRERKSDLSVTAKVNLTSVEAGQKVIISATATGGDKNYTYSYLVYNKTTNTWARLTSSFVSGNTFTWTAGSAGKRVFYVEVKDSTGKVFRSEGVNVTVTNPELQINGKSNVSLVQEGDKVIITGTAKGGSGSYTYSYLVYNKTTGQWARLTPSFTNSKVFTWTAGNAGTRDFYVEVKDSEGTVVRSKAVSVKVITKELTIIGKTNATTVQKGGKVTITGNAIGGNGNYTYSYLVYNKTTNSWARLTPSFVKSNTFTWTAGSIGKRLFYVEVKDSTGEVVRSVPMTVTVE